MKACYTGVSFARTPLEEVSSLARRIEALGWRETEDGRGDPWAATFRKDFPEDERDPEAELREVMGDYWLDADAIKVLLASKSTERPPPLLRSPISQRDLKGQAILDSRWMREGNQPRR